MSLRQAKAIREAKAAAGLKAWAGTVATPAKKKNFEVRGVLAGAYKGKDVAARELLSHYWEEGAAKTLCNRVPEASLADVGPSVPSCTECKARFAKLQAKGLA